ncbi:MAG: hypothetical protein ACD_28C00325G0005 [uncultured bacterium]|nr:MAG: hypothetical protein ACD_28C00325G0005 [uncultured bacterium]KKT74949.1 MAG: hypothetical protein UW70_C0042G0007 [Candidatus Peregrinibacteria bacterium GW2011_GWA2_44_7]
MPSSLDDLIKEIAAELPEENGQEKPTDFNPEDDLKKFIKTSDNGLSFETVNALCDVIFKGNPRLIAGYDEEKIRSLFDKWLKNLNSRGTHSKATLLRLKTHFLSMQASMINATKQQAREEIAITPTNPAKKIQKPGMLELLKLEEGDIDPILLAKVLSRCDRPILSVGQWMIDVTLSEEDSEYLKIEQSVIVVESLEEAHREIERYPDEYAFVLSGMHGEEIGITDPQERIETLTAFLKTIENKNQLLFIMTMESGINYIKLAYTIKQNLLSYSQRPGSANLTGLLTAFCEARDALNATEK